ncbi:MAG: DNA polymerase III subunit delta, partial [SAR202 cluster bacterium]|nr:DNA polymerase III subunit delta [SAR202 cluster bacterium]
GGGVEYGRLAALWESEYAYLHDASREAGRPTTATNRFITAFFSRWVLSAIIRARYCQNVIHLYYGDDALSIRETVDVLKASVQPPEVRDVNVSTLDGVKLRFDELRAACDTVPFLAEKRLVIVEGLLSRIARRGASQAGETDGEEEEGTGPGEWTGLGDYLAKVPPTTELVFVDGDVKANNPLLVRIKPVAAARRFALPKGIELQDWIRRRALEKGMRIHPRAVAALAEAVGNDLPVLNAELDKLAVYCWEREVALQDVQEMVSYTREANIFAIVDGVVENRPGEALIQIGRYLEAGNHPLQLMATIGTQIRRLLLAKELRAEGVKPDDIGQRLRLSGYPLKKTLQQEPRLTRQQLVEAHDLLVQADLGFKTSSMDEELALDILVADMCAVVRKAPARR